MQAVKGGAAERRVADTARFYDPAFLDEMEVVVTDGRY